MWRVQTREHASLENRRADEPPGSVLVGRVPQGGSTAADAAIQQPIRLRVQAADRALDSQALTLGLVRGIAGTEGNKTDRKRRERGAEEVKVERGLHLWNERDQARQSDQEARQGPSRTPTHHHGGSGESSLMGQPSLVSRSAVARQGLQGDGGGPPSAVLAGPLDPQRRPTTNAGVASARCARSSGRWKLTD